jgi:hypothetical protein
VFELDRGPPDVLIPIELGFTLFDELQVVVEMAVAHGVSLVSGRKTAFGILAYCFQ